MSTQPFLYAARACASLILLTVAAKAGIVSDNNLRARALPDYTVTTTPTSVPLTLSGEGLYSLTTTIVSTQAGHDISSYYVAGISLVTPPTSGADLLASVKWSRSYGKDYPSATHSLVFANTTGASIAYYNLGMGAFSQHQAANYQWQASANTLYGAAGTDGNLVPNASFENSDANFFSGGPGTVVTGGVQGVKAWQVTGQATSYIAVPVLPGTTYEVSFWYAATGNGAQYEYGFSKPENGFRFGAGNTSVSTKQTDWKEVTTTFTPKAGQTTWYLGGMSNTDKIQFDSIYVAAVSKPATTDKLPDDSTP